MLDSPYYRESPTARSSESYGLWAEFAIRAARGDVVRALIVCERVRLSACFPPRQANRRRMRTSDRSPEECVLHEIPNVPQGGGEGEVFGKVCIFFI